jgi:DNA-binding SARP family transcriptional activator
VIRFSLLGPVVATRDGLAVPLGGPKQRGVLAMLLLNANRVVSIGQIVDGIWADHAPERAFNVVQVYVSALRRALEPPGAEPERQLLVTRGQGYQLRADEQSLDVLEFLELASKGRRLMETFHYAEAGKVLRQALSLWNGPALTDVADRPFAEAERAALEESRLAALEARIVADLALGRYADLVAELRVLVAEQPLRERFHGLLMEALYRTGRQGDALAAFRHARAVLADELGVDPSPELRDLERRILAQGELDQVQHRGRSFLLLHDGGARQQVVPLDPAQSPISVGRRSSNDICLGWDSEVSRVHTRFEHADQDWWLVDDHLSRNGSFVDGERVVGRYRLRDGQVIRLGATVLVYRSSGADFQRAAASSGVTSGARIRSAAQLTPHERALLRALADGSPTAAEQQPALDGLRRRFDVAHLPPDERDEVLVRRARALGALAEG